MNEKNEEIPVGGKEAKKQPDIFNCKKPFHPMRFQAPL